MDTPLSALSSRLQLSEEETLLLQVYSNDCLQVCSEKNPIIKGILLNKLIEQYKGTFGFNKADIQFHMSLLSVINEDTDADDPNHVYTIEDILTISQDLPNYLVPPLIRDGGGLYILSAAPKVGKTLLAYNLLYSVAVSGNFLGFPCNTGPVLMYECE